MFLRYFFLVLFALIVLGLFNGLVFFPVLLVMLGPPGNLTPTEGEDTLPPPSPKPSPARFKAKPPKVFYIIDQKLNYFYYLDY